MARTLRDERPAIDHDWPQRDQERDVHVQSHGSSWRLDLASGNQRRRGESEFALAVGIVMDTPYNPSLHRYAVFTACCTFLLLIAGALVTSNDAGLSIPDWPLAYGSLTPPMVGGIRYEFTHRVIATCIGVLTIILAAWLWRAEKRPWMRWLGIAALGGVIAQGILGGMTVRMFQPPAVSAAHATLAQLFFSTVVAIAVFTGSWWTGASHRSGGSGLAAGPVAGRLDCGCGVPAIDPGRGVPAQGIWNYSASDWRGHCYNTDLHDGRGIERGAFRTVRPFEIARGCCTS